MTGRPETRKLLPGVLMALVAVVLCLVGTPFASGAFTKTITNTTNTAASGIYATCTGEAKAASAYFVYPFAESAGTTAADASGSNRPGTYTSSGVTYGAAGPCSRDAAKAITLNGTSGYVSGAQSVPSPATFSEEVWFKTTTTTGGKLIGLGSSRTGASVTYDRHIYLTNTGSLVFGVYPGSYKTIASPSTYRDGTWHQVVASLAPSTDANPGMRLYVDGVLVNTDTTVTTARTNATAYWRVGYDNLSTSWPSSPTSDYFKGSLAYASVYTSALSPAEVLAQYNAG